MSMRDELTGGAKKLGGHALVIGGSLAGLLAARVLCDYFDRVTVVERDRYPGSPEGRKGVPQGDHVHVLMMRGRLILDRLFPGLRDEMTAAGALMLDMAGEAAWLTPAGWGVRFYSGLRMLAFTRPLLDWHVRRRVAGLEQVRLLDDTETLGLLPAAGGVAGAVLRSRSAGQEEEVLADLVVDACGRGSRAPQWLEALGYPRPDETVVNAFIGYSSRMYRIPADWKAGWKCAFVQAAPPERTRAGIIFPVEGGRWLLTLMGGGRDYPPADDAGFMEFARGLADPIIHEAVKAAEPLSQIRSYRATENRLRHFERLARQPDNFLAVGDAVCAFNPVYGQGMTVAAMGALALHSALGRQRGGLKGLARRFQKKLAKVCAAPWLLATSEDLRFRETEGASPNLATRLMHAYMDRVLRLTTSDPSVRRVLLENFHMLKTPASLFHPRIVLRVLRPPKGKPAGAPARNKLTASACRDTAF